MFTGEKLDISQLRIFGCSVYIHVPKEKRKNLESSGRNGTFLGCSDSSKVYRIYIPELREIEVSRDVSFEEDVDFRIARGSHMEWTVRRK